MSDHWISVFKESGRKFFYCEIRDPETGRVLGKRSTKETRKREALIAASKIAEKLISGEEDCDDSRSLTFDDFVDRFEKERHSGRRDSTRENMKSTVRKIREVLSPKLLRQFARSSELSKFEAHLREEELSLYSVKRHMSNVRTLLRWAHRIELIDRVPFVPIPDAKDLERTKGRAISEEEFDRIVRAVPRVVGMLRARSWARLLRGMWLSGLRRKEALALSWDEGPVQVDLSGITPRIVIAKGFEKNRRGGRYPMTPDFFTFLIEEFSIEERTGKVFHASSELKPELAYTDHTAGKIVQKIGQEAGVKAGKGRGGSIHFASSHDFRRSFGVRWSKRVEEEELRRLMRHSSIETTREFYIGREEDELSSSVWDQASPEDRERLRDHALTYAPTRSGRS